MSHLLPIAAFCLAVAGVIALLNGALTAAIICFVIAAAVGPSGFFLFRNRG